LRNQFSYLDPFNKTHHDITAALAFTFGNPTDREERAGKMIEGLRVDLATSCIHNIITIYTID